MAAEKGQLDMLHIPWESAIKLLTVELKYKFIFFGGEGVEIGPPGTWQQKRAN